MSEYLRAHAYGNAALADFLGAMERASGKDLQGWADAWLRTAGLDAISVETGQNLWSWETPGSNYSPVLATAGGILFNGSMDRYLRAFDARSGRELWRGRLPAGGQASPMSYWSAKSGRQFVVIPAGGAPLLSGSTVTLATCGRLGMSWPAIQRARFSSDGVPRPAMSLRK